MPPASSVVGESGDSVALIALFSVFLVVLVLVALCVWLDVVTIVGTVIRKLVYVSPTCTCSPC